MSQIKDGGPAFPDPGRAQSAKQRESLTDTGMTLRDYFAAKAMQGMNANPEILQLVTQSGKPFESHFDRVARKSYEIAEAMLRAREQS